MAGLETMIFDVALIALVVWVVMKLLLVLNLLRVSLPFDFSILFKAKNNFPKRKNV